MSTFRYNKSNLPTWYPTNIHAPCKLCGCHGPCKSNYGRTVYLCQSVESDSPMPDLRSWVHILERPCKDPGMWTRFLEPCIGFSDIDLSTSLAGALGVDVADLRRWYPFAIDPVHHHGVLPAMAANGTPEGVYMFRNQGPQQGEMFMMHYSSASPVFPNRPASSGCRLYCMASITDAVQGQAAGFDTTFNGSRFLSATAKQHLADYARACNVSELVVVAGSKAGASELRHMFDVCEFLNEKSDGLPTSLAQVPAEFGDFGSWSAGVGFDRWSRLPDERLIGRAWAA